MKKEILVSVIIPIYNGEKYVERCLNGIKLQTINNQNFEVVFIDDDSKDNSYNIIHSFMQNNADINVKYIKLDNNCGIAHAKTTGIYSASGKYIIFHDQDDWMEYNCLEVLTKTALANDADLVSASYREIDNNEKTLRIVSYTPGFSKWFLTALHGVLFRKEIFIKNKIMVPDKNQMEDAYLNANFAIYANKYVYLNDVLHNYLIRMDSTSGAKNNNSNWNAITLFKSALDCYIPLFNSVEDKEDKDCIEYMVIKEYYWFLLHNNRYSGYKQALKQYKILRNLIIKNFPNYKNNGRIKLFGDNGDRKSGQRMVFALNNLEKTGLFRFALWLFIFISKYFYL